jgi:hypothetical protein
MTDFEAFLANCLGNGEEVSKYGDGNWSRDQINLSLGAQRVRLIQRPVVMEGLGHRSEQRGQFVPSTIARLFDIAPGRVEYAKRFSYDLADLLSFAAMSPVRLTGYHYPADEERGHYWSVWGVANVARPVIDIRQPKLVRHFLTSSWSRFRRLRRQR